MTVQCIRCDDELKESGDLVNREYMALPYKQGVGALPLCKDCFDAVKPRDLWSR